MAAKLLDPWENPTTEEYILSQVGEGWHTILRELFAKLPDSISIVRVKEKFGGLRIHYVAQDGPDSPSWNIIYDTVLETERASWTICEVCGDAGELHISNTGWIKTLCSGCSERGWNNRTWEPYNGIDFGWM